MPLSRRALLTWAAMLVFAPAAHNLAAQSPAPVTIFVVRHAERASTDSDSPLSEVGKARADRLAVMLGDAGITHAFTTEFIRTRETAAPLAARAGIIPTVVAGRDLAALVGMLQGLPGGSRALVAGHSNTVNVIVGRLTGQEIPALADSDYDRLYIVTLAGGTAGWTLLKF